LLSNTRKVEKLQDRFGGVRELTRVPDMLFVVDVNRETTAVREANILKIPVLGLVDTNCDPSVIDYVIPSNDDAIRAIKLMVSYIADAALEGSALRQDKQAQEEPKKAVKAAARRRRGEAAVEELTDEELLGSATLAKVAEEQAKVEAEAVAKAAKVAAAPAEAKPKKPAAKKPAKRAAAPKARKPKTKIRKSDLEGEGGDKA
jgi:small subunit ribosomal protein S2